MRSWEYKRWWTCNYRRIMWWIAYNSTDISASSLFTCIAFTSGLTRFTLLPFKVSVSIQQNMTSILDIPLRQLTNFILTLCWDHYDWLQFVESYRYCIYLPFNWFTHMLPLICATLCQANGMWENGVKIRRWLEKHLCMVNTTAINVKINTKATTFFAYLVQHGNVTRGSFCHCLYKLSITN